MLQLLNPKLTGLSTGLMKAKEPKKLWMKAKCDTSERTCKIFRLFSKNSVEKLSRVIFSLDLDPDKHTITDSKDQNWRHNDFVLQRKDAMATN